MTNSLLTFGPFMGVGKLNGMFYSLGELAPFKSGRKGVPNPYGGGIDSDRDFPAQVGRLLPFFLFGIWEIPPQKASNAQETRSPYVRVRVGQLGGRRVGGRRSNDF